MRYRLKDNGDGWWVVQTCWKFGLFWCYAGVIIRKSEFPHLIGAVEEAKIRVRERFARKITHEFTI